jgi:hypothetical protein
MRGFRGFLVGAWLLAAGAAVLGLGGTAQAGFVFNYTVTPGSGELAGKNVFNFYAKNDQKGEQYGSKSLLVMEVHFKTTGAPFTFDFRDVDGDGQADANVFGKDFDESNGQSTFMRIGSYAEWLSVLPRANTYSTQAGAADPRQGYSNVSDFLVSGFSTNKALDATQGMGRYFGTAVVPAGVDINVFGKVAAEVGGIAEPGTGGPAAGAPVDLGAPSLAVTDPELAAILRAQSSVELGEALAGASPAPAPISPGPDFFFNFVATAPEPGGWVALGLGAAMLGRRRR